MLLNRLLMKHGIAVMPIVMASDGSLATGWFAKTHDDKYKAHGDTPHQAAKACADAMLKERTK